MQFKKNELGSLIKEIRLSKQLTQDQFAKLCDIKSFQNISNIERGIKPIGMGTLDKVCKACKLEWSININLD